MAVEEEKPQEPHIVQVGRTFWDLLYSIRFRIGAIALIAIIRWFHVPIPTDWFFIVLPAAMLGLGLGLIKGFLSEVSLPPPVIVLQPLTPNAARIFLIYNIEALELDDPSAMPIGTSFGSYVRLADTVEPQADKLSVKVSSLHKLAAVNPLEALAHVRSLPKLAEQLDETITRYIELYVSTRAQARQLARRYISELMSLEKAAEKAAVEEIRKAIKGEQK